MGGGGGGGIPSDYLKKLEEKAKEKLKEAGKPIRHVFISFAHEDLNEVNLLRGQAKNESTELDFDDHSVKDPYDSKNAEYIKAKIREKISNASVTVVYLTSESANSRWVNWEIQESIKQGKGVIGIYKGEKAPTALPSEFSKHRCKAIKWEHQALAKAIEEASQKRE